MKSYNRDRLEFRARALYNGYPIVDECSVFAPFVKEAPSDERESQVLCDDFYGRFFTTGFQDCLHYPYGQTVKMPFYKNGLTRYPEIIDELRVPYRRIPIFKVKDLNDIKLFTDVMKDKNPDNIILFRGQNKLYLIDRPKEEKDWLYGDENVKEPSFLPSFLRPNQKFAYTTLCSSWHQLASILLNDLNHDNNDVIPPYLRSMEEFHTFALWIAQHYGLPSVGIDLTDNLETALWFAINYLKVGSGTTTCEVIGEEAKDATIYVFRCDKRAIFKYNFGLEKFAGNHRPLAQNAWFHHGGWGLARNQIALQLMCGFRVNQSWNETLPSNYYNTLFPSRDDDYFLDFLIKMQAWFEGSKVGELLKGLYY